MNHQITQALEALADWLDKEAFDCERNARETAMDHPQAVQSLLGARANSLRNRAATVREAIAALSSASPSAAEPMAMTLKAKAFDWLLAHCLVEDDGGWLRLVFETSRLRENHLPDCAKWVASDIAYAAGLDGDAINEVSTLPNGLTEAETTASASVAGLSGAAERESALKALDEIEAASNILSSIPPVKFDRIRAALRSTGKPDGEEAESAAGEVND